MEAPDGVFDRHARAGPGRLVVRAGHAHQSERQAIRVLEGEDGLAEAPDESLVFNAGLDEPLRPVPDRTLRDVERGLLRLADADPAGRDVLPGEERQDRAGPARLIAVVEVIRAGIVEV